MKNVECSRFGTILHLEIQKGKEDMKTSNFQKYIRGTTACMKRLATATKRCGQLISNDTYFADSWFISEKLLRRRWLQESIIAGQRRQATRGFV